MFRPTLVRPAKLHRPTPVRRNRAATMDTDQDILKFFMEEETPKSHCSDGIQRSDPMAQDRCSTLGTPPQLPRRLQLDGIKVKPSLVIR